MKCYQEKVENESVIPGRIYFGDNRNNSNFYPLHWHYNLEFDYAVEGRIQGKVNGKTVCVDEGDFLFVNSGELHETRAVEPNNIYAITILISYDLLKEYCSDVDKYYFDFTGRDASREKIKKLIILCAEIYRLKNEFYELELSIRLRQICSILLKNCMVKRNDINQNYANIKSISNIKKAISYMENYYQSNITLAEIAGEIGLAPTYFSRFFKKYTGDTFYSYLRTIRLYHAYQQLIATDDPITEIAMENGFANVKAFIVAFSEEYCITPAKYRKDKML